MQGGFTLVSQSLLGFFSSSVEVGGVFVGLLGGLNYSLLGRGDPHSDGDEQDAIDMIHEPWQRGQIKPSTTSTLR